MQLNVTGTEMKSLSAYSSQTPHLMTLHSVKEVHFSEQPYSSWMHSLSIFFDAIKIIAALQKQLKIDEAIAAVFIMPESLRW